MHKKRVWGGDQTDAGQKKEKTNGLDKGGRRPKARIFTSIYAVRIEVQRIYNEFMAGRIDEKKASVAARILGAPLSELMELEYLENRIAQLEKARDEMGKNLR